MHLSVQLCIRNSKCLRPFKDKVVGTRRHDTGEGYIVYCTTFPNVHKSGGKALSRPAKCFGALGVV